MSLGDYNLIGVTIFGSFLTFLSVWFWHSRNAAVKRAEMIAEEHAMLIARVSELEARQRIDAEKISPIVTAFQSILIKQLTHAGKPEMDLLLVKVGPPNVLTDLEHARLMVMLDDRTRDMGIEITSAERDSAVIFPIVMKMTDVEQHTISGVEGATDLKLLTIVSVVGAKPKE
jgi:hypothetical protein